jgi:hypothetical protein
MIRYFIKAFLGFLSIYTLSGQIPSYVPTNGLNGYWSFNGNANDETGNGNDGIVNGATLVSNKSGNPNQAYYFDGVDDDVLLPLPMLGGQQVSAFSTFFRIKKDNSASMNLWGKSLFWGELYVELKENNVLQIFWANSNGGNRYSVGVTGNNFIMPNNWYDIIITYQNSNIQIYINGNAVMTSLAWVAQGGNVISTTQVGNLCNFAQDAGSHKLAPSSTFKGIIDEFGIWNRALTQLEITEIFESTIPISASASTISNVTCFNGVNGIATVTPSGGTPPFSYSWNSNPVQTTQTATGLKAGVYTVTVTDSKGAVTTAKATVTQPTAITNVIASAVSNVGCFGGNDGSVTVSNPTGGTPPYTYLWNTSPAQLTQTASNLVAGTYIVTVTDSKGCTQTSSATVTQPAQPLSNVIASTVTNVGCFGGNNGSVTVSNPTGGTPPYTYSWNTSPSQVTQTASNLVAGTYIVTVTDSKGCTTTSSATVTQPTQALSNVIGQTIQNVKCNGTATGIITVTNPVGGTPPYSYKWNTSPIQTTQLATNVPAGVYSVTVTDINGCIATAFTTVTEPTNITNVQASVVKNVQCHGEASGSAKVSDPRGGTPPYTYQWNTFPVQNTQTAINLKVGTYIVTVSDSMGCQTETEVSISQPDAPLSITNPKVEQHITCYGLSDGIISIQAAGGTPPYVIVWNTQPVSYSNRLIGVPAGLYTAVVIDANACKVEATLTVNQPPKVMLTSPKDTTVLIQSKAELVASSNNPASNYTWQSNIGIGYQNLENVFQYSGVKTSKLTIDNITLANNNQPFRCIIETNGCFDTTAIAILTVRTNVGVDDQGDSHSLLVYPNPTGESDELLVQCGNLQSQILTIELLDIMGVSRAYSNINVQAEAYPIRISGLAKGMYTLRVHTSSEILTEKVIIN